MQNIKRFYGTVVHDAYCKSVGEGKYKAEWTTQIPEAGEYEVYYTVYDSLGGHEIRVEPAEESMGWVSLGKYYLEKGEAKVVLDDRGGGSEEVDEKSEGGMRMMQNKQMIVADAVKWVRRGR